MSRLTLVLVALIGVLAGGLGVSLYTRQPPPLDEPAIRTIVEQAIAERIPADPAPAVAELSQDKINPMIESFLMSDPKVLQRVSEALNEQIRAEGLERNRVAIASMRKEIFEDPDHIVVGNPQGDVTLVELFDYNCTYCRAALPDLTTLLAEDPNLKVILKEFPILSQDSIDAARVGVLVAEADVDYLSFHETLFSGRGVVNGEAALNAAAGLGLDRVALQEKMQSEPVTAAIEKSYSLARALNITGTPTYIIGDELIPGAVGIDGLRQRIANMRACGKTVCES